MIIKAKFKDYYDYVGHIFGGGDTKIVYERKPFEEDIFLQRPDSFPTYPNYNHNIARNISFCWVCVAGKYHLAIQNRVAYPPKIELFNPTKEDHAKIYTGTTYRNCKTNNYMKDLSVGINSEAVRVISKQLNSPVFIADFSYVRNTDGKSMIHIWKDIPKLGEIGFPSVIKAEQIYQDIAYFISNTINESPDNMPITQMSDKEKVIQHGFDIKKSFRNCV